MRTIFVVAVALVAAASFLMPATAATPETQVRPVAAIRAGGGSDPQHLTRAAGLVFFSATDGVHGRELWATDGTDAGTRLVRDIKPGAGGSRPALLTTVGSRIYFTAADGTRGRELWVSDGTRAGTKLVKDLAKGAGGSAITSIGDGGGTAYFARDGRELLLTDGTPAGTRPVREFTGVDVSSARWLDRHLFFSADDALWKTDGSPAGTRRLSPVHYGLDELTKFRGRIFYRAHPFLGPFDGPIQLWRSDGSKAGTGRVGTMVDVRYPVVMDGSLYFDARATATTGSRLYRSDGSVSGTGPIKPRVRPMGQVAVAGHRLWSNDASRKPLYEPDELWVSDGSAAGTALVYGGTGEWFVTGWDGLDCAGLGGRLWFAAGPGGPIDEDHWTLFDHELWTSDGTPAGTYQAADINVGGSSFPRDFVKLGTTVLFSADDGEHGRELWALTMP